MSKTTKPTKTPASPRKLARPTYRSFRLQKRIPREKRLAVKGSFRLFRSTLGVLRHNWKLFLGITAIYALLNILLVQGFFNVDVASVKQSVESTIGGHWGKIAGGFSAINYLIGASGTDSSTNAYRLILSIIASLAFIWAFRQLYANNTLRVRDSFYEGMYPLIPFIVVFIVISLQLVPLTLGLYLYSVVGAASGTEAILWIIILAILAILTLYMLSSSIFALYIACLPGMTPLAALRSAVQLVRYRRFIVLSRLIMLPIIVFIIVALVMIPLVVLATPVVAVVFFIFLMTVLPIVHGYLYALYRELLRE